MNWFRVFTNNGWRVFPETIREAYLKKTSSGRSTPEPVTESGIDMPGMIMSDRTYQEVELDGLRISIPTTDFALLREVLVAADVEILSNDVECVKMRGWLEGIVMTPEQRTRLLANMGEVLPAVVVAAGKENREFVRRLSEAQKKSPIQIISQRQERLKEEGDDNVPKPN